MIINLETQYDEAIEKSVKILKNGGTIVYPTDTLYGLGADATNDEAVKKVFQIKKRSLAKPVSVIVSGLTMLTDYFEPNGKEILVLTKNLPGPYTFILKTSKRIHLGLENVGVRVPSNFFCRKITEELGKPIISTSANISDEKPPSSIKELSKELINSVDLVVDGGKTQYSAGSTVVDIKNEKIIRQGIAKFSFD